MKKCDLQNARNSATSTLPRAHHTREEKCFDYSLNLSLFWRVSLYLLSEWSIDRGEILAILNLFLCVSLLALKMYEKVKGVSLSLSDQTNFSLAVLLPRL